MNDNKIAREVLYSANYTTSKKYTIDEKKKEYKHVVNIDYSYEGRVYHTCVKSRKWFVTGKWMPATIFSDINIHYFKKELLVEVLDILALAAQMAVQMDAEHAPLGPSEVE